MSKEPIAYMFTREGIVQFYEKGDLCGMVLSVDRGLAQKFADYAKRTKGENLTIAEIGTVQGETVGLQLEASLAKGANCAFILKSVEDDDIFMDVMERRPGTFHERGI